MISEVNEKNERVLQNYLRYLAKAVGLNELTVKHKKQILYEFIQYLGKSDFQTIDENIVSQYKESLQNSKNQGNEISGTTLMRKLNTIGGFTAWLKNIQ
ncbi:site-specific integrase [candidate division KSB1 bacterium]|nr:site-specific integrase [candidate division KSB1 bacterium]